MHINEYECYYNICEQVIKIKEIMVISSTINNANDLNYRYFSGEFGLMNKERINETSEQLTNRLTNFIKTIINNASEIHKNDNFEVLDNNLILKDDKKNNITRVSTNEFLFYTARPLILHEFEMILQKIMDLPDVKLENFHLILGTFAVKVEGNAMINVAINLECGIKTKLNLIVKNYISDIDPVYTYEENEIKKTFLAYTIEKFDYQIDEIPSFFITINNEKKYFSFSNIFESKTAGGTLFNTVIEICVDHFKGQAKDKFTNLLKKARKSNKFIPSLCTHVVISNCVEINKEHKLSHITHVDPENVKKKENFHLNTVYIKEYDKNDLEFKSPCQFLVMNEHSCKRLKPIFKKQVDINNNICCQQQILLLKELLKTPSQSSDFIHENIKEIILNSENNEIKKYMQIQTMSLILIKKPIENRNQYIFCKLILSNHPINLNLDNEIKLQVKIENQINLLLKKYQDLNEHQIKNKIILWVSQYSSLFKKKYQVSNSLMINYIDNAIFDAFHKNKQKSNKLNFNKK